MNQVGEKDDPRDAFHLVMNDDPKVAKGGRNEVNISSAGPKDPSSSPDDAKIPYSVLVDRIEKLEREAATKTKELEQRVRKTERNLGISPLASLKPWRFSMVLSGDPVGSDQNTDNNILDMDIDMETFRLNLDVYSILSVWEWNTKPFWASLFVVILQILLLVLLIVDLINGATEGNSLRLPGNVEYTVRIAQAAAVLIIVFKQEDLREGIEGIFQGTPHAFRGDIELKCMKPMKWRIGYFLRFIEGFLSMLSSFILLMQAESVFDLLVNFLGIEFISDLDNLAFRLGRLGYFGITTRDCVNTISEAEFRRNKKEEAIKTASVKKCSPSWWRKHSKIMGVFSVFIAMAVLFLVYTFRQIDGDYLPSIVQVEFGDETLPFLGIYSGCYMVRRDIKKSERFVLEQMGRSTLQGKLAYCGALDDGSWVLLNGEDDDPCEKKYIVRSKSTKTFDVEDTVESQWKTNTSLPLDYLQIYKVPVGSGSCSSLEVLEKTGDSCLEIELDLDGRPTSTFQKRQLSVSSEGKALDAIRSHPIYVGADERVVIFTGRRWVLANLTLLGSWENTTTLLDDTGNEAFYKGLMDSNSKWILSISEPVDRVTDQGTPLGLQWYFPQDIGDDSDPDAGFSIDLTRLVGVTTCASCSSKTNPCLYEGVCNDKTGKCECKNGASGKLCRVMPLGDGICNPYFNTREFDYDAGDCCASTCGVGVAACDNSRIGLPYGVDVIELPDGIDVIELPDGIGGRSKESKQSRAVWFDPVLRIESVPKAFGYDKCRDPNQATFTIELTPSQWKVPDPESTFFTEFFELDADFDWYGSFFCTLDFVQLACDDKPYMEISTILVATVDDIEECPTYRQTFQVPYGVSCDLTYENIMRYYGHQISLTVKLFHGTDGVPIYEDVSTVSGFKTIDWETPPSKCITEAFSNTTKSIFDRKTIQGAAVNKLSSSGRAVDWCKSENEDDREMLFERFALEALLSVLDTTETFLGESHHCRVPLVNEGFGVGCNKDDRVTAVEIESNMYTTDGTLSEILEYLPLLPQLETLIIRGTLLKGTIPVGEIANLQNLTSLSLFHGLLNGTIPTEIGTLKKLERIYLTNNSLTGEIPSELFSLERLRTIYLDDNALTGPAVPREMFSLPNIWEYGVSNNQLTGSIPSEIQNVPSIYQVALDGNNITGTIPSVIGTLRRLISLGLGSSLLTGTIPTEIGNLGSLWYLNLSNNRLTKTIPTDLGRLRSLNWLYMDSNLLTGTIPTQFGNLETLKNLTLFRNRLSGLIPYELANVSTLELCIITYGNSNMTSGSVGVCS